MRLFMNSGIPKNYFSIFQARFGGLKEFDSRLKAFLEDRYGASHFLKPVFDRSESTFFTNANDEILQRLWAKENGLKWKGDFAEILLAQIEQHKAEVFYNLDSIRFDSAFAKRLPGCVKKKICWHAGPLQNADLGSYDMAVCNFPSVIEYYKSRGWRSTYFSPSHDPVLDDLSENEQREIDVLFVGTFSRLHKSRTPMLEAVVQLADRYNIRLFMQEGRATRLAETPFGLLPPLKQHRMPRAIRAITSGPAFGMDFYRLLSHSKIVLNGACDVSYRNTANATLERGNMRIFEAMGSGALHLGDAGLYPEGMKSGENMLTYESPSELLQIIPHALENWEAHRVIAMRGNEVVRNRYSKQTQWEQFVDIVNQC